MALATWEPDLHAQVRPPGPGRLRCLVDLDAPCNLACRWCRRRSRGSRLGKDAALALVEWLAEEVVANGATAASAVFYGGEPLLARDELLAQARVFCGVLREASVECHLGLITNGTQLDQGTVVRLVRTGFTRLSVTMGGTCDQHEARRGAARSGPTYQAILENLAVARHLLEVVVRYELHDDMDLARLPEFVADLEEMGLLGGERPVKVVAQPPHSYAAQARAMFAPGRMHLVAGGGEKRGDVEPV